MSFADDRRRMVATQLVARGIQDGRVLDAMRRVQRHRFVPSGLTSEAYEDHPIALGRGQTISQPYMVARMLELCALEGKERVLEIGAGSGYQTAVLCELAGQVYAVEIIPELCEGARDVLRELGYKNVTVECFDGSCGWPDAAPFDVVVAAAGAPRVPMTLVAQLAMGGRLVMPIGERREQRLVVIERTGEQAYETREDTPCRFVDLVGRFGWGGAGPPRA